MTGQGRPPLERVLLVHDYGGARGGAELVIQDLRAGLRARGIDARLLASDADPSDTHTAPDYRFRGSTGPARAVRETWNPSAVRVARRAVREFAPQVVHLGMFLTQASPGVLPVFRDRPVVWVANEYRVICPRGTRLLPSGQRCLYSPGRACVLERCFRPRGIVSRLVQLRLLRRAWPVVDMVVAPSEAFAAECRRFGIAVGAVVPNAVGGDLPAADDVAVDPHLIGFAGRLVREKGAHVLLDAMALLPEPLAVRIVGDGPERPALEVRARRLGIAGRVEFLGHVTRAEVHRQLASAAVQVVTSMWPEPFGLVTVEAMRRGTPVVASAVGAAGELIRGGYSGFLVPPGDPAALARCLARVLSDPDGRAVIRRTAMRESERFSPDRVLDRLLEIYTQVLAARRLRA